MYLVEYFNIFLQGYAIKNSSSLKIAPLQSLHFAQKFGFKVNDCRLGTVNVA